MDLNVDHPIAALASPPGGAARGIVRISGIAVSKVLDPWFEPDEFDHWKSAKSAAAHFGKLRFAEEQQNEDEQTLTVPVQVLYWPSRKSYTGQPLIELYLPGSPCLLEAVLSQAYRHGARPARPGEFTMRAFLAGKIDLLQAEAVLGVIDANNDHELRTALAQLAGGVSAHLGRLRNDLIELLADLEAGLDFVDEDIEFVSRTEVVDRLTTAHDFVSELLQQTRHRMQSRVRRKVVLAGLPNAGKSTLFNRLSGTESALVSPQSGTTRDFLVRTITWGDLSFELIDTAGWEQNADGIAAGAQVQLANQLEQSDLLIWCTSATLTNTELIVDIGLFKKACKPGATVIRILTQIDQLNDMNPSYSFDDAMTRITVTSDSIPMIPISAFTGTGLTELRSELTVRLTHDHSGSGEWLGVTAARCRETLESIVDALGRATQSAHVREIGDELIAADLREVVDHFGVILGVVYTDDILDRIFSKFCIGK